MSSLLQDLRYAARMVRANPGVSLAAVLVLALGIGANSAVFTIVNGVLLRPLPYRDPGHLLLLWEAPRNGEPGPRLRLMDRSYLEFRRRDHLFEGLAAFVSRGVNMTGAGEPGRLAAAGVTGDFLRVLGVTPMIGRSFTAEDETATARVAVIGAPLWRERFAADPRILGRSVKLDGVDHTIVGVMPPGFAFPDRAQVWVPVEVRAGALHFAWPVVGRLKSGVTRRQAEAELQSVVDPRQAARVAPFQELMVADVREPLLIFDGAVAFVLLIACANVANLLLIRAAGRRREIAVRAALGAGSRRLIRQLLTESTLLALIGGAAGLLIATWGVPMLLALAPEGSLPAAEIRVDAAVLAFTAAVSLGAGLLFGLAPASHVMNRPLRDSLAGASLAVTRSHAGLRGALVVAEMALALVLLAGGGLMLKSFLRIRAVDPGFRAENVLTLNISLPETVYRTPAERRSFEARLIAKLASAPGVSAVGAVDLLPLGLHMLTGSLRAEGVPALPREYRVDKPSVSPGYFQALGIRLLRGRDFTARDDLSGAPVAMVSRSVAREVWRGQDPIGKRVSLQDRPQERDWLTVVGVVEDVRQYGLTEHPSHAVYRPSAQATAPLFAGEITFVVRTAIDPLLIAGTSLRQAVYEVDPNQPVASIQTMQELLGQNMAEPLFETRLLAAFSVMALLLAALGVYGVLSFTVAEQTREIGIRMTLGAAARDVKRQVLRHTMTLAAAGLAIGGLGALAATRVLANLLFEVKPADPAILIGVAALLAAVAALAAWIPARRATRVDPVVALRYE